MVHVLTESKTKGGKNVLGYSNKLSMFPLILAYNYTVGRYLEDSSYDVKIRAGLHNELQSLPKENLAEAVNVVLAVPRVARPLLKKKVTKSQQLAGSYADFTIPTTGLDQQSNTLDRLL